MKTDTIVAPATPPGIGGVGIIRISGPCTQKIAETLLGQNLTPRYATYVNFYDQDGSSLDQGLALFFKGPHSFTGEDVLECHGHGGIAVMDQLLQRILSLGARLARPGEFSERAFLNDKIDLLQAEAIADLIESKTASAARAAMRSLQGDFSKKIHALVETVIYLRSYVEAAIDFSDEAIEFLKTPAIVAALEKLNHAFHEIEQSAKQGCLLRDGITLVIAGEPNVGKSSLLNRLTGRENAIVTSIAGTTRDVLREMISLDGIPIQLLDTAGIRESSDEVEQMGIQRAHLEIAQADYILWLIDAYVEKLPETLPARTIVIRNKIDLTQENASISEQDGKITISLSAKTGVGIDLLKNHIKQQLGLTTTAEGTFSARRRHLDALVRAQGFLNSAQLSFAHQSFELFAEDLRQMQMILNEITGEFTTDDLLGHIFASFCIGK